MTTENDDQPGLDAALASGREEALRFIDQLPSDNFFQALTDYLALTLQLDNVLIGRVTGHKPETVQTVGLSVHGHPAKPVEYELAGTPCENVVGRNLCYYPLTVAQLFPSDHLLESLGVQSYLGVPLNGPTGKPLGLISVMSRNSIQNAKIIEQVLNAVKPRTEQELQALITKLEAKNKRAA